MVGLGFIKMVVRIYYYTYPIDSFSETFVLPCLIIHSNL